MSLSQSLVGGQGGCRLYPPSPDTGNAQKAGVGAFAQNLPPDTREEEMDRKGGMGTGAPVTSLVHAVRGGEGGERSKLQTPAASMLSSSEASQSLKALWSGSGLW